jgi:hypothetical protein
MKIVVLVITLLSVGLFGPVRSQTFSEWFQQKKTQKKYLVQQIALLQVYLGYLKKGYTIVNNGITTVRQIRSGEFDLHSTFYTSLSRVNPQIKQYSKAAAILRNQQLILSTYRSTIESIRGSPYVPAEQTDWLYRTCQPFLEDVAATTHHLIAVLTNGRLKMSDNERIGQIDKLYDQSKKQLIFIQQMATDASMLKTQRSKDQYENEYLRRQYQLK